jgi:hypothetical protein
MSPNVVLFPARPANGAAAGKEFTGNGYQRKAAMSGAQATRTGKLRKIANTNNISFGPAPAARAQLSSSMRSRSSGTISA